MQIQHSYQAGLLLIALNSTQYHWDNCGGPGDRKKTVPTFPQLNIFRKWLHDFTSTKEYDLKRENKGSTVSVVHIKKA